MNTKEQILQEALKLFAKNGFAATSMSDIASKLNISKAALYKHYSGKQEILDSIVNRMEQMDEERAKEYEMPEGTYQKMAEKYIETPVEKIRIYSEAQFRHWTEDEFASDFRRMLTLEQYSNDRTGKLYQAYLTTGPITYMEKLFQEMFLQTAKKNADAKQTALDFYGSIYLLMSIYDSSEDKKEVIGLLREHVNRFINQMEEKTKNENISII